MPVVKVNGSDITWIERNGLSEPVAYGTDIKGVAYFTTTAEVAAVGHVKFAGADMIEFDFGPDAPRDHGESGMYPASYLVKH